ncbi:hypothetical protein B0J14DRAFT_4696 [Halenospora varia]|nr:hypothetical protein B0J14DRAFT_4696 [Halenospora varia]
MVRERLSIPVTEIQLSSSAAGFALGFGIWTLSAAIKQTRMCEFPRRSFFIWMIWVDLAVNTLMGLWTWIMINGYVDGGSAFYSGIVSVLWILELQLYYQIIINRCGVVVEDRRLVTQYKWMIFGFISFINISVLIFWIPAQNVSPASFFYKVNKYWDRISKGILLLLDVVLNLYFLRVVRRRIVQYHGLVKYMPLVRFNAWLMIVSVLMDAMLIGFETLALSQGSGLWQQFHPLAYIVKLKIEMSLATLIAKISKASILESSTYFGIDLEDSDMRTMSSTMRRHSDSMCLKCEQDARQSPPRRTRWQMKCQNFLATGKIRWERSEVREIKQSKRRWE